MCAGALVHARIERLVIGARDTKAGACGTVIQLIRHPRLNHAIPAIFGVLKDPSSDLLKSFFRARR